MLIEIKHRATGTVLFAHNQDSNTVNTTLELAVKTRTDLSGAYLSRAYLYGANLMDANLPGANLSRAYLSGTDLSGANLSGTDLSDANLSDANLSGANLSGTDLSRAYLFDANLSGANLSNANLAYTYLTYTNLSGANLMGAKYGDGSPVECVPCDVQLIKTARIDQPTYEPRRINMVKIQIKGRFKHPILGQEAICPDGLGRVVDFRDEFPHAWIKVNTYVNDRQCQWSPENVELIDPRTHRGV